MISLKYVSPVSAQPRNKRYILSCITLAIVSANTPSNIALAEAYSLEEVVVTATRRSENMQEVPISVSAVTGSDLKDKTILNISDIMGHIPNLQINSPWGTTQPNFNLRGVGVANEFNANVASPIGVYFDEVYEGFRAAQGVQIFDIDRIEVVKGPQGTLYGRNTTGGAINIISTKPELGDDQGYLTLGYGNYNRKRIQAAYETTPIADTLGIRAALNWIKGDGYLKNRNSRYGVENEHIGNDDYASEDSIAGRLIVRWLPSEKLDLSVKLFAGSSDPIGAAPIPEFPFFDGKAIDGFSRDGLGNDEAVSFKGGKFKNDTKGMTFTANYALSDRSTLINTTGYSDSEQDLAIDFAGSILDVGNTNYVSRSKAINEDIRLDIDFENTNLIIGAYFGIDSIETNNELTFFGFFDDTAGPDQFNPGGTFYTGPDAPPPTSVHVLQDFTQERSSWAVYAEGAHDFNAKFSTTVGIRYTEDTSELNKFGALYLDSSGNPALYTYSSTPEPSLAPLVPNGYLPDQKDTTNSVTGRIIGNYQASEDVMIYASYSRGYRAGAYNGLATAGPEQIYLTDPEEVDALELGVKSRFMDDRIQANGALFYYDYANQQIQEALDGVTFLRNLNSTVFGGELEIIGQASESLRITSSIGYLDTEYKSKQQLSGIDIGGNDLPFAPEWTANLGAQYLITDIAGGSVMLTGDLQYKTHQWFDPFNDKQAVGPLRDGEDAYTLANARVSYEKDSYSLSFYVKNISDEYYKVYGINTEGFSFNNYFIRGEPRTFGLELTLTL